MTKNNSTRVIIIGAGFAGLNAAKQFGNKPNIHVTVLDKRNHHLFQPLLYQVATAGLSAEDIATPIRSILARYQNINVVLGEVIEIDIKTNTVHTHTDQYAFDFLIVACGAGHSYFGHNEWQDYAPGMKSIEEAFKLRRNILMAFENAEIENDPEQIKKNLTFVVIGGGPTGVELAGSLQEMSRYTMSSDFRRIDSTKAQVILLEAGAHLLPAFSKKQSYYAKLALEKLGVTVKLNSRVTNITSEGVTLEHDFIATNQIIWAAGVAPSSTGKMLDTPLDKMGRVIVEKTLNLKDKKNIFVVGDQACCLGKNDRPLPGLAPVALQAGTHAAKNILRTLNEQEMLPFQYFDKGQMATIGRAYAITEFKKIKAQGFFAWLMWLIIHIMYLIGFRNKLIVLTRWAWMYIMYSRGARLIIGKKEEKNNSDPHANITA